MAPAPMRTRGIPINKAAPSLSCHPTKGEIWPLCLGMYPQLLTLLMSPASSATILLALHIICARKPKRIIRQRNKNLQVSTLNNEAKNDKYVKRSVLNSWNSKKRTKKKKWNGKLLIIYANEKSCDLYKGELVLYCSVIMKR